MISGYDEFTEKAYPSYTGGTKFQREIRDELINIMSMNNFSVYEYEWWHFNYNECGSGVMNYSFKDLDSLKSIS
jgi:D-alanyl-D-alanine dipeptidase